MKWVVDLDSNFFGGCFWTRSFSCESAAEYAGNSGNSGTFFGESAAECEYPANPGL